MDGTLINTLSGLVFPKDCNDWQLAFPEVPSKIKKLHGEGYKIVVLSNQGRLGVGKISISDFRSKVEKIVQRIGVPMQVFLAQGRNIYRKPCVGTWELLEKDVRPVFMHFAIIEHLFLVRSFLSTVQRRRDRRQRRKFFRGRRGGTTGGDLHAQEKERSFFRGSFAG